MLFVIWGEVKRCATQVAHQATDLGLNERKAEREINKHPVTQSTTPSVEVVE